MNQALRTKWACCVLAAALLAGCSSDPAKRKAAFFAAGEKYAEIGKYPEAVVQFRNAIEIDPRFATAHYRLGLAYFKLKAYQEAYREFSRTLDLQPENADARLERATLLLAAGQYAEAQAEAQKVVALDARNGRAHAVLGQKHVLAQEWALAIREFETAVELDPLKVENYAGLAFTYSTAHRNADAEATLRRAIETQPKSVEAYINLGRFYNAQHRLAEAEAAMRAAAAADPHATIPLVLLAKIYMDAGKPAEAARVSQEIKTRAPDDPAAYRALATFYEATGQKEKAADELRSLMASKPKDSAIKAQLTEVLLDLNRLEEAARLNQEQLSATPEEPHALSARGRILLAQQNYSEAKQTLERAVHADPQLASAYYYLGVSETLLGLTGLARTSLAKALELAPGMNEAAIALAELNVRAGDYDGGLRLASKVIQNSPNRTSAYVTSARALLGQGNAAEAEAQLRAVLERDPGSIEALAALVDVEASLGRLQDAVRRISAQASAHPENARFHFLLGVAYLKENDLARSESAIQQALARDQKTPDAWAVLAEISSTRGALDEAIARYKTAIDENPRKPETYMGLSGLYERKGEWLNAQRAAERARELDPGSPYIANNLAYLYLQYGGDAAKALSLAEEAKQKLPNSPIVFDTVGWAHYKLRSADAAVAQLSESVRRAPANPVYRYHLGMAYMQAGRLHEAAQSLEQALSINAHFPNANDAKAALERIARGPA